MIDTLCKFYTLASDIAGSKWWRVRWDILRIALDRCFLSQHQLDARAARMSKLLDLREDLEFARAVMHDPEFILGSQPETLAFRVQALEIQGPEGSWLDEYMGIWPPCEMWVRRLLYACEIESLRVAENAWAQVQRQYAWRRKVTALPD